MRRRHRSQPASLWAQLLILGIGLVFFVTGAWIGIFDSAEARADVARAERLSPSSAAQLDAAPVGVELLLEGTASPRNSALFRDFVAYTVEEYRGRSDDDGDPKWDDAGGETPRLLIEAGGVVQVGNGDYSLEGELTLWQDRPDLAWDAVARQGTRRYSGLVAGQPVTAIGVVAGGREGNELHARVVFGGSRADYIAARRGDSVFLAIFGGIFGLVGLIVLGVVLWGFLRR
jgi:hypothetical protein